MPIDEYYMKLALQHSLKARGMTSPNPLVGAVIVKHGRIISTGFHRRAGSDHAEIIALRKIGAQARGATFYVTLEPCNTFGKTPPCTDALIKAGIKKVVVGMLDPNPNHNGRGIRKLRAAGICVVTGVLSGPIRETNQVFIKYITKELPYVTVKIAQSLDGKIATRNGESKWITSRQSRGYSHRLRNNFDAVLVGKNTAIKDDPLLNSTLNKSKKFYKIILDTNLNLSLRSRVFLDSKRFPVIIATSKTSFAKHSRRLKALIRQGAIIIGVATRKDKVEVNDLCKKLALLEITSVLVEGGGEAIGSFFDASAVDYALFFVRPGIIGGSKAISSVAGEGISSLNTLHTIRHPLVRRMGSDIIVEGPIRKY